MGLWRLLRGGIVKTYNVILAIPVEVEVQIEAENEEVARTLACGEFSVQDFYDASYLSYADPEVVEAWEMK
jgi:hypothetical protein